jgi:hypothetical protein
MLLRIKTLNFDMLKKCSKKSSSYPALKINPGLGEWVSGKAGKNTGKKPASLVFGTLARIPRNLFIRLTVLRLLFLNPFCS